MKDTEEGQTPIKDISGLKVDAKTQGELDIYEYQNYGKAVKQYRLIHLTDKSAPFSYEWFKRVHQEMLGDVWEWAGEQRTTETTPGVPKEKIGSEIHRLIYDLHQWESEGQSPQEIAVFLHHRLVFIHPFINGNGRFARLVANIYLRKKGFKFISWSFDSEHVNKIFRPKYLKALKAADQGDYSRLANLHQEYADR